MKLEGGFQGRINKLVDGCYSFWQGGSFPLLEAIYTKNNEPFGNNDINKLYINNKYFNIIYIINKYYFLLLFYLDTCGFFDREALQEYILLCCQNQCGGLLDKPRK